MISRSRQSQQYWSLSMAKGKSEQYLSHTNGVVKAESQPVFSTKLKMCWDFAKLTSESKHLLSGKETWSEPN